MSDGAQTTHDYARYVAHHIHGPKNSAVGLDSNGTPLMCPPVIMSIWNTGRNLPCLFQCWVSLSMNALSGTLFFSEVFALF